MHFGTSTEGQTNILPALCLQMTNEELIMLRYFRKRRERRKLEMERINQEIRVTNASILERIERLHSIANEAVGSNQPPVNIGGQPEVPPDPQSIETQVVTDGSNHDGQQPSNQAAPDGIILSGTLPKLQTSGRAGHDTIAPVGRPKTGVQTPLENRTDGSNYDRPGSSQTEPHGSDRNKSDIARQSTSTEQDLGHLGQKPRHLTMQNEEFDQQNSEKSDSLESTSTPEESEDDFIFVTPESNSTSSECSGFSTPNKEPASTTLTKKPSINASTVLSRSEKLKTVVSRFQQGSSILIDKVVHPGAQSSSSSATTTVSYTPQPEVKVVGLVAVNIDRELCDICDYRVFQGPTNKQDPIKHSASCTRFLSPGVKTEPTTDPSASVTQPTRPATRQAGNPKGKHTNKGFIRHQK